MKKTLPYLLTLLPIAILVAVVYLIPPGSLQTPVATPSLGSVNAVGGTSYYLYGSGVAATDSSITLTSFKQPVNQYPLRMADFGTIGYLTLEPGNSNRQEFVSFSNVVQNTDGTATLTGVVRGLAPVYPFTASSTIQKAHGGGTVAVLSNPPQFYQQFYSLGNIGTSTNVLTFSSTTPPRYDQPGAQAGGTYIATTSELASIAYVNAVSFAGTSNATTLVKGIIQLATGAQAASSTALGSTAASLVLPGSLATDTPGTGTSASRVVVSDLLGNVWKNVVANLGLANTFTATTTFTAAVIPAEVTLATSTSMTVNFGGGSRQLIRKGSVSMAVAFSNYVAGESLALTICNPHAGAGGALTFTGVLWPGGTAPVLTTTLDKCDIVTLNATNATSSLVLLGGFNLNY